MRMNRSATMFTLVALTVLCATTMLFAFHVRGSSDNGVDNNAPQWLLVGRAKLLTFKGNGKTATMRREIVCPQQDVENALPSPVLTLSGSCDKGNYMFVYQFQSTATNVTVSFKSLTGFTQSNGDTFGVIICDSTGNNTIELCSNTTSVPNITTTTTNNSVTFTVPGAFPQYPPGTAQQGQGLTFFIITQQTNPLPLGMEPTISIQ